MKKMDHAGTAPSAPPDAGQHGAAHTPGPWLLETNGDRVVVYVMQVDFSEKPSVKAVRRLKPTPTLITDFTPGKMPIKEALANARLIAAAPDLLEALKMARECIAYCRRAHRDAQSGEGFPVEIFLDTAIAKATGAQVTESGPATGTSEA